MCGCHSVRSPGRFVSTTDAGVHTQNIETRNRHLKDTIKSVRDDCSLAQYIAEFTYRERRLKDLPRSGQKLFQFVNDIRKVYPGPQRKGLKMRTVGLEPPYPEHAPHVTITHSGQRSLPPLDDDEPSE